MPVDCLPFRKPYTGCTMARPYLDVLYINPDTNKTHKATALIDTGADRCIVPAFYAPILGHNLKLGYSSNVCGIGNETTACYLHTLKIEIPAFVTEEVLVLFSETVQNPILGVKSFLSNFCVTVDYPSCNFSLRLPPDNDNLSLWSTP